jgi:uncharacterized lipoprotein YajG
MKRFALILAAALLLTGCEYESRTFDNSNGMLICVNPISHDIMKSPVFHKAVYSRYRHEFRLYDKDGNFIAVMDSLTRDCAMGTIPQ